jgi:hypothetical protein
MGLARIAHLGRHGADSVAFRACFRFPALSVGDQRSCYVSSFGCRSRVYRVGLRDSAAILRLCRTPHLTNR